MTEKNTPKEDKDNDETREMLRNPYFFKPLWSEIRRLLQVIGTWHGDTVVGEELFPYTKSHDTIRRLVGWNFLSLAKDREVNEYERYVTKTDWDIEYKITRQARDYARLETNNVSDLRKAILILLRAEIRPEQVIGFHKVSDRTIKFYQLVMLLNKSERTIYETLEALRSMNLLTWTIWLGNLKYSDIAITERGITYIEHGGMSMMFNNINIVNSNVGVVSLQSTLTNIDASVGNIKQKGYTDLSEALSQLTEQIMSSELSEHAKKEVLEQVELIGEEALKEPNHRKPSIVKGSLAFLEKALNAAAGLASIWAVCGPAIRKFFGF